MYDFTIEYIPREKNLLADAMTRLNSYFEKDLNDIEPYIDDILEKSLQVISRQSLPNNFDTYTLKHQRIIL
ncbi:hypothetical protein HMI55_003873 [Coelomomyces lativittatus]|nr:hypothetical protein HMI55_003873 [Coelomomyces lativittatus]